MIGRDGDVGSAFFDQTQHGREHAADGPDLPALGVACRRHRVVVAEQFVCAVDQMDIQGAAPKQPYRSRGCGINPSVIKRENLDEGAA